MRKSKFEKQLEARLDQRRVMKLNQAKKLLDAVNDLISRLESNAQYQGISDIKNEVDKLEGIQNMLL